MTRTAKVGRNAPCPCGSGSKFKHCCEQKPQGMSRAAQLLLFAVAGIFLVAIVVFVTSMTRDLDAGGDRVWSAEHGHWHDVR